HPEEPTQRTEVGAGPPVHPRHPIGRGPPRDAGQREQQRDEPHTRARSGERPPQLCTRRPLSSRHRRCRLHPAQRRLQINFSPSNAVPETLARARSLAGCGSAERGLGGPDESWRRLVAALPRPQPDQMFLFAAQSRPAFVVPTCHVIFAYARVITSRRLPPPTWVLNTWWS